MKKNLLSAALTALFIIGAATGSRAQNGSDYTPFMLSLATPLQVPPRTFDVGGLRINLIYGECRDFDGLDISTVGRATGYANGLQAALVANVVDGSGVGLQIAPVNYVGDEYVGLPIGVANYAKTVGGLQIGALFNKADYVEGVQIGLINVTRQMIGVQIGLINVIQDNDVKFLPIFNCSF